MSSILNIDDEIISDFKHYNDSLLSHFYKEINNCFDKNMFTNLL